MMLATLIISLALRLAGLDLFALLFLGGVLILLVYLLLELKKFYGEGWGRTIWKFLVLTAGSITALGLLYLVCIFLILMT